MTCIRLGITAQSSRLIMLKDRSREKMNMNTHKAWDNFKKVLGSDARLFWQYVAGTDYCPGHNLDHLTNEHAERMEKLLEPNYYVILKIWHAKRNDKYSKTDHDADAGCL
jgi:hypothetical protein